ncbi:conserved hypothetical protein [Leptospira interrogans serovar Manilae]|uniref:Uncharacterized protein n=1 Tax=Leptospira interrogans serovar Manilae TaxID=214675 RepID=A0AAQ1P1I8_LEPIR|nr:conserved hypothetical protein [Leptospira interrogans serovar Manilae]
MNTFNKYALYYLKSKTQHLNPKSFWGSFFIYSLSQNHPMWELLGRFNDITHNYIVKYLIFCMGSVFCDKINGTQFYRDQ